MIGIEHLVAESGPIERATLVLYILLITALLVFRPMHSRRGVLLSFAIALLLLLRELDFDKAFTTKGIFKLRFYTHSDVPLAEKLIVVGILGVIALGCVGWIRLYGRAVLEGVRRREPASLCLVTALALALLSKGVLDGLQQKLVHFGVELSTRLNAGLTLLEEVAELGIPASLLLAVILRMRQMNPRLNQTA